jgi:hypothetical protein
MNDRFLELYKQAQIPYTAQDPSNNMPYETTCFSAEKFAELIVRECAKVAEDFVTVENNKLVEEIYISPWQLQDKIKEHFGVE